MDVIILDKNFNPLAPVNSMRTLIWDRRAKEPGMFELHCGAADFESIEGGAYVYRMDRDELGVIQESDLGRDESGARICYAKGYFAEVMLNDRVVDITEHLAGEPEDISRDLVSIYFVNASGYDGRKVDVMELGARSPYRQEPTKFQATGKTVGSVIAGLEDTYDLMHRLRFDFGRKKLTFMMSKGRESGAIFSDEYANIRSATYHRDSSDAPNIIFVAGAGEGADRKRIVIDLRDSTDDYAREMYVDARDLQQSWEEDGVTKYYTDADYNVLLYNRGMEKIAGHKVLENFQVDADPTSNLLYREDYDVGDWGIVRVTVHGSLKFELERQITAIKETYEAGKMSISITFGDYGPRSLNSYVAHAVTVNEVVPSVAAGGGEDLSKLTTTDKSSLVGATNEVNDKVGNLNDLGTASKDNVVAAVNELEEDVGNLEDMAVDAPPEDPSQPEPPANPTDLTEAVNSLQKQIGTLSDLSTADKDNLVAAINEASHSGGGSGVSDYELPGSVFVVVDLMPIKKATYLYEFDNYTTVLVSGLSYNKQYYVLKPYVTGTARVTPYAQRSSLTAIIISMHLSLMSTGKLVVTAGAYNENYGLEISVGGKKLKLYVPYYMPEITVRIKESTASGTQVKTFVSDLTCTPKYVSHTTQDGIDYYIYVLMTSHAQGYKPVFSHGRSATDQYQLIAYASKHYPTLEPDADLDTGSKHDMIGLAFRANIVPASSTEKRLEMTFAGFARLTGNPVLGTGSFKEFFDGSPFDVQS